ncbi:hypothetical protein FKM82_008030 [Ascaphus truei]
MGGGGGRNRTHKMQVVKRQFVIISPPSGSGYCNTSPWTPSGLPDTITRDQMLKGSVRCLYRVQNSSSHFHMGVSVGGVTWECWWEELGKGYMGVSLEGVTWVCQ